MKKFTTLCLSLLFAATTFAQTEPGTFSLLPKVGLNLSSLTKSKFEVDTRTGFCGGIELNYQLNKSFSLTLGALYSLQGCKQTDKDHKTTVKIEYLNVPVLFNFHITNGLVAKVGVQPGLVLSDRIHQERKGVSGDMCFRDYVRSLPEYKNTNMRDYDIAIPIGLSYEFSNIVLDARYCPGLVSLFDHSELTNKNSVFQFTLGYKFEL